MSGSLDIWLGRYRSEDHPGRPLEYDGENHLLLFGPSGCGKGTRVLIPNLLRMTGRSIIVIDPKGELTAITAKYRRSVGDVVILNPFGTLGLPGAGFNPLVSLDLSSPTFFDDAVGLAEALIKIEEKEPHWSESAQGLLVAFLMWEVIKAKRGRRSPTLENVRRMMTEGDEKDAAGNRTKGYTFHIEQMMDSEIPELGSLVSRFRRDSDEIASVRSTADRQSWWLLSKPIQEALLRSELDFADLKRKPTTVYIILPAERMRTHAAWLRLLIVSALRALYTPGGIPVLFMLDEFAQLGHLGPIEDAFGLVRGYGLQIWPILQDLTQLKQLYRERWETFVANAGIVQAFPPNDLTTADWLSRRAGDTTIVAAGYNAGDSQSERNLSSNQGMSYQQAKRSVFLPQELMDMGKGAGVIFSAGSSKAIPFAAPSYWEIPEIAARAEPNPYVKNS